MNVTGRLYYLDTEPVSIVKTETGYEIYGSDDPNGMPLYQGDDLYAALEYAYELSGEILIHAVYRKDEDDE